MQLYHATTRTRLAAMQQQGLLVSKANKAAKIQAV